MFVTYFVQLSKTGTIKLPEAILEQLHAEGFTISLKGEKVILSPVLTGSFDDGILYANLSPHERAAEFQKAMTAWHNNPNHPKASLTDEQLRREHIYED